MKLNVSTLIIICSSLFYLINASAGVFKCTVDGKVTYTQIPCSAESTHEVLSSSYTPDKKGQTLAQLKDRQRNQKIVIDKQKAQEQFLAIRYHKILLGMEPSQVKRSWGKPSKIHNRRDGSAQ